MNIHIHIHIQSIHCSPSEALNEKVEKNYVKPSGNIRM